MDYEMRRNSLVWKEFFEATYIMAATMTSWAGHMSKRNMSGQSKVARGEDEKQLGNRRKH